MTKTLSAVSCIQCKQEIKSLNGLFTHMLRKHGTDAEKSKFKCGLTHEERFKIRLRAFNQRLDRIKNYYQSPNHCKICNTELDWFSRKNTYCSHSCSAKQNNFLMTRTEAQNIKTSESLKMFHAQRKSEKKTFKENFIGPIYQKQRKQHIRKTPKRKPTYEIVGQFSKIYFCKCKFCSDIFTEQTVKQICNECKVKTNKLYVDFRFDFNVYDYPDLFDLNLLQKEGWFSPRGKSGRWNPTGLSRDHRVSVSEAVKNNYDPFYIKHPINCELMTHIENNKKKTKSSMLYSELVARVNEYEKLRRSDSN